MRPQVVRLLLTLVVTRGMGLRGNELDNLTTIKRD